MQLGLLFDNALERYQCLGKLARSGTCQCQLDRGLGFAWVAIEGGLQ